MGLLRRLRRLLLAVALTSVALAGYATLVEPDRLLVREERLQLRGWPRALDGLRIAVLGDIHTGAPFIDEDKLREVVRRTNRTRPDLVALVGDYVIHGVRGGRFVPPERTARVLGGLRARHGVFAVLGNHDGWLDAPRVAGALASCGLRVLENESVRLGRGDRAFWVAGVEDPWTGHADIPGVLAAAPDDRPLLLLVHNPDVFPTVGRRATLTLAGHTHGGQVRLPFVGGLFTPSRYGDRYGQGVVRENGRTLFVTGGLGTSIVPVRLGVPPEIAVLRLYGTRGP